MEAGIVGLPNVGKSTLFNALTGAGNAQAANYPFCTIEPNEGIVSVPDERLTRITKYIVPQKVIPAILKLVDIAGIVKGASEGQGLGNKFLSHIREVDAILQVVRCFTDPDVIHVGGKVDPLSDIETIEMELMFADIEGLEGALPKAERAARTGDKEAKLRVTAIQQCMEHLNKGLPLRTLTLGEAEQKAISSFGLMTAKPILYIANVDENDLEGKSEAVMRVREYAEKVGAQIVPVCAKLEAEIAELDEPDRTEMLQAVGLSQPALQTVAQKAYKTLGLQSELDEPDRTEMLQAVGLSQPALQTVAQKAYKTLGLQSYFTAGEKEVRAWTIPVGATAPQAAGVIHTDFERGFIRAEVYQLADLETYGTEKEIRSAGKLRTEGKTYVMQDGDICHFLFNV